jgi:hypothetical protein
MMQREYDDYKCKLIERMLLNGHRVYSGGLWIRKPQQIDYFIKEYTGHIA